MPDARHRVSCWAAVYAGRAYALERACGRSHPVRRASTGRKGSAADCTPGPYATVYHRRVCLCVPPASGRPAPGDVHDTIACMKDTLLVENTQDTQITVGAPAPDLTLLDQDGHDVALSSFWRRQPTVFVFLRHFG